MNTISRLILTSSLLIAPVVSMAQSSKQQEVIDAVEKVYNEELQEDTRNYNVYFRRAHLYYGQNQYLRALADIDNAIKYTPADDRDLLSQEYALRANIYIMTDRKEDALADLNKALEIEPASYALLYQKANIEFELGNYAQAKENFQRLGRLNSRSLESLIGLARIAVKENNLGLANEYVDEAVAFYPAESEAYLRRASVRELMGNNTGAVDDMILALAVDKNSGKAVAEMVNMANKDYNAVIVGLSNAISQAPNVGVYYYLRAMIAQAHYHYIAAIADYNTIIDKKLYNYHGIDAKLAECYYALCDYPSALDKINVALGLAPSAGYYTVSSRIYLALGNTDMAKLYAERALTSSPDSQIALAQLALCAIADGDYALASDRYGELII
ncbi:MAG: tetratricopeptide repeat protein, partial [Muribaculaceae bacterium]|nr:tetratricopeptide repeat protein [Muribaculaceae bacterium]